MWSEEKDEDDWLVEKLLGLVQGKVSHHACSHGYCSQCSHGYCPQCFCKDGLKVIDLIAHSFIITKGDLFDCLFIYYYL